MNKSLQILAALACLAVILCAGVWLAGQNEQRRAARKEREAAEMVARFEREAWISAEQRKSQTLVDTCAADLQSYDKESDTFAFVQRAIATGKPLTGEQ